MKQTLVEKDGWLYVLYQYPDDNEPEMIKLYWPLKIRAAEFVNSHGVHHVGGQLRDLRDGRYELASVNRSPITFRLPEGGETRAEFVEREPIPEPKQRGKKLETRWRSGRWEKYTQSRGWQAA